MKKAIILLSIFLFLVSFVSAVDFTDDIVGYFNMSSVTNNYDASGRNNNGSLVSVDSCSGFDYTECLMKSDGCKDKNFRGKIKGKCGVECTTDNDCGANEECSNYKCEQKEGVITGNIDA